MTHFNIGLIAELGGTPRKKMGGVVRPTSQSQNPYLIPKSAIDGLIDNDEKIASSKNHNQFKTRVWKSYLIWDQNGQNRYPTSAKKKRKEKKRFFWSQAKFKLIAENITDNWDFRTFSTQNLIESPFGKSIWPLKALTSRQICQNYETNTLACPENWVWPTAWVAILWYSSVVLTKRFADSWDDNVGELNREKADIYEHQI